VEVPPSPPFLTSRTRSALIVLGIAGGSLIAGAAFTLLLAELIRFVSAYWPWIVGAVALLVVLAGFGAVAVGIEAREARLREQRLRKIAHLDRVDAMTGAEFEALVADLLRRDDYRQVLARVPQALDSRPL
jgi:restriction system protein